MPETRCRLRLPDSPPVFGPPLPSRTFLSFGIKALSPTPFGNACLYELPDLPSLPISRKLLTIAARWINAPDPLLPVKLAVPKPAEPRRTAARWDEGKPEAKPQGGAEGGRRGKPQRTPAPEERNPSTPGATWEPGPASWPRKTQAKGQPGTRQFEASPSTQVRPGLG